MTPGIGLMDRRLKTEKDAISLATSGIAYCDHRITMREYWSPMK